MLPHELWVIDGQHRLHAIKRAINSDNSLKTFPVPVTILNVKLPIEQKLFYIINERQKGVKTDLVQQLIWSMARKHPKKAMEMIALEGKKYYSGLAIPVIEYLAKTAGSPWKNKIRIAYQPKTSKFQIPQNTVAKAISEIIHKTYPFENYNSLVQFSKKLIDYWNIIKQFYPKAFKEPENYTIQRFAGINAFSKIFPTIIQTCDSHGGLSKRNLKKILNNVKNNLNQHDPRHKDDLFWNKVIGNDLAKSTNMKAVNELVEIMKKNISR
jgi:DGQHR domain-containing protein